MEVGMPFRVTDASINDRLVTQITTQRQRLATAQEQLAGGKRINRPSDDPIGAAAVIEIRTSQASLGQFERNVKIADSSLSVADGALDSYDRLLDRTRSLLSQGVSGFTGDRGRDAIATEIDGLNQAILNIANLSSDGQYVFGGTRQNEPPFDPTTAALSPNPTSPQLIQIELAAPPITVGVTADFIFSSADGTVFDVLRAAALALRGTGDPAADEATLKTALQQLGTFAEQSSTARTTLGTSLNAVEVTRDRISRDSLSLEEKAQEVESADFAKSATDLVESERALEAILQTGARTGRRSLLDFLG